MKKQNIGLSVSSAKLLNFWTLFFFLNYVFQIQATPVDSAGRTVASTRSEAISFGLGRGGSTPTSMPSSSSLSSISVPSFHAEHIHHHAETVQCQQQDHQLQHQQQMISAKQESHDSNYYYSSSNCNNTGQQPPAHASPPAPAPVPAINQTAMNFMDHGSGDQGNTFPSFYSLMNANNCTRRADEMLSGHGYRSSFVFVGLRNWMNEFI